MSHTNLLFHIVFATKNRLPLINDDIRTELHKYLCGTSNALGAKCIAVGGVEDHVHLFIKLKPTICLSDFMRRLKSSSSAWVRRNKNHEFTWQARYGAFSVSQSNAESVKEYIRNQKRHHRKHRFADEYRRFLSANNIDVKEEHLWN